jgi:hypothetical protein
MSNRKERKSNKSELTVLRERAAIINQFHIDFPYCNKCGGRRPKDHKCDNKHKFVKSLGDYDLYCDGVKACFVPFLMAKNNMVKCPICGEPVNYATGGKLKNEHV